MSLVRRHRGLLAVVMAVAIWIALGRLARLLIGPARCRDGWASPSIGHRGVCSWHGGVSHAGDIWYMLALAAAAAAGLCLYWSLEEKLASVRSVSIWDRRCPKCRGSMHEDRSEPLLLRCDRHPLCEGQRRLPDQLDKPDRSTSTGIAADGAAACPRCSAGMVVRKVRRGPRAGHRFYGCTHYPRCRGTRRMARPQ